MTSATEKKSPAEANGDCAICKGWVDDGMGGTCIFTYDFYTPHCPYDEEVKRNEVAEHDKD